MTNETHFSFLNGASLTKDMYHRWPQIYHRLESQSLNEIRPWRRGRYIDDQQVISYKLHLFFLLVLLLESKIQERERGHILRLNLTHVSQMSRCLWFIGGSVWCFATARQIFSWKHPEEKGRQYWKPQVFQHFNHQLELTHETSNK